MTTRPKKIPPFNRSYCRNIATNFINELLYAKEPIKLLDDYEAYNLDSKYFVVVFKKIFNNNVVLTCRYYINEWIVFIYMKDDTEMCYQFSLNSLTLAINNYDNLLRLIFYRKPETMTRYLKELNYGSHQIDD